MTQMIPILIWCYLKRERNKIWLIFWIWSFNLLHEILLCLTTGELPILAMEGKESDLVVTLAGLILTRITISKPSEKIFLVINIIENNFFSSFNLVVSLLLKLMETTQSI
jgi:hypothetical protein